MKEMDIPSYIVYLVTDPYTGKQYAGQTKQKLSRRLSGHVTSVRRGDLTKFGHAIAAYGVKNFKVSILREGMTKEQADEEERLAIMALHLTEDKFGYNILRGGTGSPMSEEAKRRLKKSSGQRRRDVSDELIISLYKSGNTMLDISKQVSMTFQGVWWRLKNAGIKRRRGVELPEEDIISLYRSGYSQNQIGAIFGTSDSPIYRILKKHGIKYTRTSPPLPKAEEAEQMYREGRSTRDVAIAIGVSAPFVNKRLREMGVAIRKRKGWKYERS